MSKGWMALRFGGGLFFALRRPIFQQFRIEVKRFFVALIELLMSIFFVNFINKMPEKSTLINNEIELLFVLVRFVCRF